MLLSSMVKNSSQLSPVRGEAHYIYGRPAASRPKANIKVIKKLENYGRSENLEEDVQQRRKGLIRRVKSASSTDIGEGSGKEA